MPVFAGYAGHDNLAAARLPRKDAPISIACVYAGAAAVVAPQSRAAIESSTS
jgi:hypothetical protein